MKNEITKTTTNKGVLEMRAEINANGTKVENIYFEGQKIGIMGFANEEDKQNALKILQVTIDGSNSIYEGVNKLMTMANFADNDVNPSEEIDIEETSFFIDYTKKILIDENGEEVVNCTDISCNNHEAIKAILTERAKNYLNEYSEYEEE